jgi:phage terminase Nu1 subunit (DNA packaging protein)
MSKPEAILSDFLTKQELATEFGCEMRTLDRWDTLGIGPPRTHVGRKVLYRRASVERWLAAREYRAQPAGAATAPSNAGARV